MNIYLKYSYLLFVVLSSYIYIYIKHIFSMFLEWLMIFLILKWFWFFLDIFWEPFDLECLSVFGCINLYFQDRANEIYKKVEDQKPLRGRNQDAILAACLYIACRQEDKPRTVKGEILFTNFYFVTLSFCEHLRIAEQVS